MASSLLSRGSVALPCGSKLPVVPRPILFATPCFTGIKNRASVHAHAVESPGSAEAKPAASYASTSDKYAIVDVGGVQHLVEEGRWYTCNRLKASPGDVVSFGRVLAMKSEGEFHVGRPYVEGVTVEAEIIEDLKGPKVVIYKMAPKKHTRKLVGHRQELTKCAAPWFTDPSDPVRPILRPACAICSKITTYDVHPRLL